MKYTEREKQLLEQFYEHDMSRQELAELLHVSTASIRSMLKHCRDRNGISETAHLIAVYFKDKKK